MRRFDYDAHKDQLNQKKHGVSFKEAQHVFDDPNFVIINDELHSDKEHRFFCFGQVAGDVMTVRFTLRNEIVRIFGAAYWRKGRKIYEEKNSLRNQPVR